MKKLVEFIERKALCKGVAREAERQVQKRGVWGYGIHSVKGTAVIRLSDVGEGVEER